MPREKDILHFCFLRGGGETQTKKENRVIPLVLQNVHFPQIFFTKPRAFLACFPLPSMLLVWYDVTRNFDVRKVQKFSLDVIGAFMWPMGSEGLNGHLRLTNHIALY